MGKGNKVGKTDLSEETYRKAIAMLMVPFAGKLMLFLLCNIAKILYLLPRRQFDLSTYALTNDESFVINGIWCVMTGYMVWRFCKKNWKLFREYDKTKDGLRAIGFFITGFVLSIGSAVLINSFYQLGKEKNVCALDYGSLANANVWLYLIVVVFMLPVIEEFLFRGLFFKMLTRKNKLAVICIQAFLFGIVHLNPIKCIYTFVFGIVLGIVYQKTQNLLFPICMHIGFNIRYPVLYLLFIAGYRLN